MFGNQTLLCQMVLRVRSCAAAIRPDWARAWRARCRLGIQHLHHSAALHHRGTSTRAALAADPQVIARACRPRGLSSVAFVFDYLKRGSRRLSSSPIRLWVAVRVRCTEPEFASIVSAAIDRLSPRYRVSCFDAFARHPRQQRSGVRGPKWPPPSRCRYQRSRGGHPSPQCLRRETHAEQRIALHSHFLKRHLGWDLGR